MTLFRRAPGLMRIRYTSRRFEKCIQVREGVLTMKQRKARGWAHIVLMCLLLAAFVVLSVGSGCAEEYAELTVTREAEAVPSALSADELAEGYIHKALYPPRTRFRKAPGGTARPGRRWPPN